MDPVSSSLPSFIGAPGHHIDDKNRITVPADWRAIGKDTKWVLAPDQKRLCLVVMLQPEFDRLLDAADNHPGVSPAEARKFSRQFHAEAEHGSPDKQGRLVLPPKFCAEFELAGEVKLVGGRGRFEVWNIERWKATSEAEQPAKDRVGDLIGY